MRLDLIGIYATLSYAQDPGRERFLSSLRVKISIWDWANSGSVRHRARVLGTWISL